MKRCWIFLLLLVPGMAFSAICKTVGSDGVASFINVPGTECPAGSMRMDYPEASSASEEIRAVETGVSGRQVAFSGYRSIEITRPEQDATVRERSIAVSIALQPPLQANHFVTVYLDGKAHRGRYGVSQVLVAGLERGVHKLRADVIDSSGKVLIASETVTFTVQLTALESTIRVDPITGDNFIDADEASGPVVITGTYTGSGERPRIVLRSDHSGWRSRPVRVREDGTWKIRVRGRRLVSEPSLEAVAWVVSDGSDPSSKARRGKDYIAEARQAVRYSVAAGVYRGFDKASDYGSDSDAGKAYDPSGDGISTTPGENNPAFGAPYTPVPTTPGKTNPAFSPN
jgi:hypothetical protein